MTTKYTNVSSVPLSIAVFLASDSYDHNNDPNTISATALIKPLRQLILSARVPVDSGLADLGSMMASRVGTAIHDGIERAWKNNYENALRSIGARDMAISRIRINPTEQEVLAMGDKLIPVYMEERASKVVGKYTVSGKYDFVFQGQLEDFKTTGVYTAMHGSNIIKYILQGSIYRWLSPHKITNEHMKIQYIFTDWSAMAARQNPDYPQRRFQELVLPLKSIEETNSYVVKRLTDIDTMWNLPQDQLPLCSDEDLWRSEPQYKYYANGLEGAKRSSKNFDSETEAHAYKREKGKGVIIVKAGEVQACKYCAAFGICTQKDFLIAAGELVL